MQVAVDISLYPLAADVIPPILDVIERLKRHAELDVVSNTMSTQVRGEFDDVMAALNSELKTTFESVPQAVFVIKMLNNPIAD